MKSFGGVGDIGSDSQRWNRQQLQQQSQMDQKENYQQYAYQGQQSQFVQNPLPPSHQQGGFSQTQQPQNTTYRMNTDQSKSPRREISSLQRSQSGTNYLPQMDTYFLTGWGNSKTGQLCSSKSFGNKVISASAGESHTMIIDYKQELFACGSNQFGQLGIEGVNQLNKPTQIPGLRDIKISMVSCGADHTFALTTSGEVYAWGLNLKGQLGIGNFDNQYSPVLVFSLLPFGQNNKRAKNKSISGDSENETYSQHKRMKSANDFRGKDEEQSSTQFDRSNSFDNLIEQLNQIKPKQDNSKQTRQTNAGNNLINTDSFGGSDTTSTLLLSGDEVVTTIACGTLHTLIMTSKNRIFSAGYGEAYALGHGDTVTQNNFKQIQTLNSFKNQGSRNAFDASPRFEKIEKIACGLTHSVCVMGGRAYVWGVMGARESLIYQNPTEMDFQFGLNNQNILQNIIDAKAGDCFSIFLNNKGDVYALGENTEGQLCSEYNNPYEHPQRITSIPGVNQIAVGKNYCLIVSRDMKYIYGWGANSFGQVTGRLTSNPILYQAVKVQQISPEIKDIRLVCGSFHTIMLTNKQLNGNEFILKEDETPLTSNDLKVETGDSMQIEMEKIKKQSQLENEKYQKLIEEKQGEVDALKKCNMNLLKAQEKNAKEIKDFKFREQDLQKQIKEVKQKAEAAIALNQTAMANMNNNQNDQQKFQIKGVDKFKNVSFRVFNSNLDIDFSELILESKISEGGYGIIHKAKWRETIVAVKKFKMVNDENTVRDFLSECHAMEALRHPNIVMFLGACTKAPNFCIILEFCQKGSLWGLLQSEIKLTWEDRRRIALDTARGVHYLHSSTPPVLHRDLKRCKLADFGWTRVLSQDNYMTAKIGTYQWMAPEVISSNYYSEKADVFSYGIILWEIASREPPYRNKTGAAVSIEVVQNKLRPIIPKNCPIAFAELMQRCWDTDPLVRPSFKEIIKELEKMVFTKAI